MNAIVDVQGFKNEDNKFIVKELAILCKNHIMVLLIKPPYPYYNLTRKERSQVSWIEKNRGLLWNEGFVPYYYYKFLILDFLKNRQIYTKGVEKVSWLKEILETENVFNLEDKNCPKLEVLYNNYLLSSDIKSCIYHSNTCALKNVTCLNKWCVENNVL